MWTMMKTSKITHWLPSYFMHIIIIIIIIINYLISKSLQTNILSVPVLGTLQSFFNSAVRP